MQTNSIPSHDSYCVNFDTSEEMLRYHQQQSADSMWQRVSVSGLSIEALDDSSPLLGNPSLFSDGVSEEAITDTVRNLGLAAMVNGKYIPIRSTAYKSLLDRAKINGTALPKLPRKKLADVLNCCLSLFPSNQALLLIRDEKVSAFHAGDQCDYSLLPIDELLSSLGKKLDDRFPGNVYKTGYTDHTISTATWEFPDQREKLLGAYIKALSQNGKAHLAANMMPGIRFMTSDTGVAAASVSALIFGPGYPIRIGSMVSVEHRRQTKVDNFDDAVDMLFSQYVDTVQKLANMMDVVLDYPVNAMTAVCKKLVLPKKAALEAIEMFEVANGTSQATAHDVFMAMQEILFSLKNQESQSKLLSVEESLSRALTLRWEDYDFARKVGW